MLAIALARPGDAGGSRSSSRPWWKASTPAERVAGLDALAELGGVAPSRWLTTCLSDPSAEVRAAAICAVAAEASAAGDPLPVLLGALDDSGRGRPESPRRAPSPSSEPQRKNEPRRSCGLEASGRRTPRSAPWKGTPTRSAPVWCPGRWPRSMERRDCANGQRRWRMQTRIRDHDAVETIAFLRAVLAGRLAQIEERLVHAQAILGAPDDGALIRRSSARTKPKLGRWPSRRSTAWATDG